MKKLSILLGAILISLVSSSALAVRIDINSANGSWENSVPAPGSNISIANGSSASDPDVIRWGVPVASGGSQSNYVFDSTVPPILSTEVPPTSPWLNLGGFTHNNFPINAPVITSVELRLDLAMLVENAAIISSFVYTFNHNETTNTSDPLASRDIVTISAPSAGAFMVGNVWYTLELRFSTNGGQTQVNEFRTYENQANTADVYGRFTSENVPAPVPEPATMLLLGSGLVGLAGLRKKFKK